METKNRPLLIIPPQFSSFEEMFNSQQYKDFMNSEEAIDIKIDEQINRFQGDTENSQEYIILIGQGQHNDTSLLEKFILSHGGQKVI